MEVLKSGESPSLISNLEVMQLPQERKDARSQSETNNINTKFQNRDWVEKSVLDYVKTSPVGGSDVKEDMSKLVEILRTGYDLTNAETLQILNHLPTSLVEVHLLLEDIEKREQLDTEEKQLDFLRTIAEFSGRTVEEGGDEDAEVE